MVNHYSDEEVNIDGLIKLIDAKKLTCHCGAPLLGQNINHHKHQDGVRVKGVSERQWVGVRCGKCGYDWSLKKPLYASSLTPVWSGHNGS